MSETVIDLIGGEEIPAAAEVLSHAFLTQPNYVAIWRKQDESMRRAHEAVFKTITLAPRATSRLWAARRDGVIAGVLNMAQYPDYRPTFAESLVLFPRCLSMLDLKQAFTVIEGALMRGAKLLSELEKHHPRGPHWYLGPIGVLPRFQGQKIGSRMLETCCEFIDSRKDPAYLDTDRAENIPFYERFGFEVTGSEIIHGVENWFMFRVPR